MRPFHRAAWGLAGVCLGLAGGCGPGSGSIRLTGAEDKGDYVVVNVPPPRADVRERMLQYLNVRSASLQSVDDDGGTIRGLLISTRFGNAAQLHRVTTPGGARTQLTFFDEPVGPARYIPGSNGNRILLMRDAGGSEDYQVFHHDLTTGKTTRLTAGKGQHGALVVSRDGRQAAFYGTGRNGRDYDTYLVDLGGDMQPKLVFEGKGAISPSGFSPDGKLLLLQETISVKESYIHLLDLDTRQARRLTPESDKFAYDNATFSADGRSVFYCSDRGGEFSSLYRHDLATGQVQAITPNLAWDIDSVAVSPAGNAVVFVANEDGMSRLYRLDRVDGTSYSPVRLPFDGLIGGMGFNNAGTHLCMTLAAADMPGDVFTLAVADFDQPQNLTRWTHSEMGGLDPRGLIKPTLIHYPTFDSVDGRPRMIPAYYYRPRGAGPFPVVISIHGGPEAQARPSFSSFNQYLASELGMAVLVPNVRGSTGYGRTYHMLDDGMKREDSVRDIGQLLVWVALQGELDSKRVAVYGGSYGGYMVLACLTKYPDRIKAGVNIVGIANFVSFLERTSDYRRDLRRVEYGDERDPAMRKFLTEISPLTNARNIRSALFVLHGQNDPRVPVYEAEQIVQQQQRSGRPVWYWMAKGEGHGFRKRSNSDLAAVFSIMFFEEHLLK